MKWDPISWGPTHGAIRDNIKKNVFLPHQMDSFLQRLTFSEENKDKNKRQIKCCEVCLESLKEDEIIYCE